ncbi:MAG TPA: twin-arginine translocase TatA/TatE family subunit [Aggregatilineaceae bacterium]|nr:twin-arginine translocase TatA/TatE family subunit [Aggregatilineaceae bacterium]
MGNLGTTELVLILAIVVVLFGVGRVSKIGGEMGSAIREFRKGLRGDDEETTSSKSDKPE